MDPSINQDGTVVAFRSSTSEFYVFDDNDAFDVFLWNNG